MKDIDVIMAVYNPEIYIHEQIESILNQTFFCRVNKVILVDDGSDEKNRNILNEYAEKYDNIFIENNKTDCHGAKNNFLYALTLSTSKYILTCDQDDVWDLDKIEVTYNSFKNLENAYGLSLPLLIATDVEVVDENLELINKSFLEYRKTNKKKFQSKISLFFRNIYPGCTMGFNRELLEKSLPASEFSMMHDWWLLNVALIEGKVLFVDRTTMKYRQHENNCLGAGNNNLIKKIFKRTPVSNIKLLRNQYDAVMKQMNALNLNYKDDDLALICKMNELGLLNKIKIIMKYYPISGLKKLLLIVSFLFKIK